MEEIEIHVSINADLVIPEWLRKKMGLTGEVKHDTVDKTDGKKEASRKALDKLADALRDSGIADIEFVDIDDADRCDDRC